jgi:hypothetical protein
MFKLIIAAILTACGVQPSEVPHDIDPPGCAKPAEEEQDFCCTSVDFKTKTGDGCVAISKENINACSKVLHCPGFFTKDDGVVTCE